MSGQKYSVYQTLPLLVRTAIPVGLMVFTLVFSSFAFNGYINQVNFKPIFITVFLIGISLTSVIGIFSRVSVWVEGNMIIIENKINKKQVRFTIDNNLKLGTIKNERISKNSVQSWQYLLKIRHDSQKPTSLRFNSKIARTEFCRDLKVNNPGFDITNLDLSAETEKVGSIGDIIKLFKDDVVQTVQPNQSEIPQSDPIIESNYDPTKDEQREKMILAIRLAVALAVIGMVIYYMLYLK